ncbi:MAG: helix-turn-helix domain-containing protein, partial [Campylobacterota bacterium]|nr:helix-turn-helix domain-containing protein [Campylobacterota bacterium]
SVLQELKLASSLVEAPNIDKKPNIKKLENIFKNIEDTKKRNKKIVQVYEKGYSQHMIAKVLGLNQATVQRIIKRRKDSIGIT